MATSPAISAALESDSVVPAQPSPARRRTFKSLIKKRPPWSQAKKDALSAKMKQKWAERQGQPADQPASEPSTSVQGGDREDVVPEQPEENPTSLSPFALSDEHEFPTAPAKPSPVTVPQLQATFANVVQPNCLPPALPGTALSSYRRCPCLAVLPGRVCTFCYGTHWTKLCLKCEGEGRIHLSVRKGAERSQPCGHCGGRGTLPANMREIGEATRLAEEFAASANGHSLVIDDSQTEFRRAVKLPGIGVTATKRVGTLSARKRERERNETRKQQRQKTAAN